MVEIRRILVPCDFSDFSRRALDHAAVLARWYGAEIAALHVTPAVAGLEAIPVAVGPVPMPATPREAVHDELGRWLAPVRDTGIRCDGYVAEGHPVDQILAHVQIVPADLIVLGTHGRSGFERWVLGSVTEKVLRKAPCPVLTVSQRTIEPPPERRPPFKRILCGIDFSASSLKAIEYALSLAQEDCAEIVLLHVVEDLPPMQLEAQGFDVARYRKVLESDLREKLEKVLPEGATDWCKPETRLEHGKAWEKILDVAGERHVDLIVMGVQGRNALDLMVFGSNTHHVIRGAEAPVLTIRTR